MLPKNKIWWWVATWFGSGQSPKAPGTAGTIAALPFAFIIQYYTGNFGLFISSLIIFFIGWWASNEYMKFYPEKHDPKQVVVDEVAGMWLVLSIVVEGAGNSQDVFNLYALSFFLFRFFDALKPWPISVADRKIKGGFGVMFDDILAAVASVIVIYTIAISYTMFFWSGIH